MGRFTLGTRGLCVFLSRRLSRAEGEKTSSPTRPAKVINTNTIKARAIDSLYYTNPAASAIFWV